MSQLALEFDALIFDCDGTLTDSMPLHYQAWRAILDPLDIAFAEKTFYELGGMPGTRVLSKVAGPKATSLNAEELLNQREEIFFSLLGQIQPINCVVDIARQYRHKLKMGVASGSVGVSVRRQLETLKISDWFDCVVAAEDTERHKPDPDVFLEAARRMNVEPTRCQVYEDSDFGIEAAKRAGMHWVDIRELRRQTE